jgi:hypothetical protein
MTSKSQAVRELARLGFVFDKSTTGQIGGAWSATIDAVGRMSIQGDCRGIVVFDYTASAAEFWDECIKESRETAPFLRPCPYPEGECEFHDE